MSRDRLHQLEEHLGLLREQQSTLEREALLTTGLPKTQAEQRLRLEIKPKIRDYEQEYWQILAQQSVEIEVSEPAPEVVVAEIVEAVQNLTTTQSDRYSDEILAILRDIQTKLNQPGVTAAAKLKGVISSIPPFIGLSYETELDTENFLRTYFPTFRQWAGALAKK